MQQHDQDPSIDQHTQGEALPGDEEVTALATVDREDQLALQKAVLALASAAADHVARQNIFATHLEDAPRNTQRMYAAAITCFTTYLNDVLKEAPVPVKITLRLDEEPSLWAAVSFGLVEGFQKWLLLQEYSIKTANDYLTVVKVYAMLAQKAGFMSAEALVAIRGVKRLIGQKAERIDRGRASKGLRTRRGHKKAEPVYFEEGHSDRLERLFAVPDDSPQGRRDLLALRLLFELGIRPSEAIALRFSDLDLARRLVRVRRQKTGGKPQYLELTEPLEEAISHYLECRRDWQRYQRMAGRKGKEGVTIDAPLLVQSRKDGRLFEEHDLEEARAARAAEREHFERTGERQRKEDYKRDLPKSADWSTQHLWDRVHLLSLEAGLPPLASYDARHQWTYDAVMGGTPHPVLMQAGGWKTHSMMVERYYGMHEVANRGVKLLRSPRQQEES
jgi:integrase